MALAKTLGIGFAGAPTRSHYWITAPDGSGDPSQPNIQLPDMRAYLRSEVGGVLLGMQEPQTRTYDPMTLENDMADMVLEEEEHDLELLYEQTRSLCDVIPKVDEWGFAHHIVGLSMYTPDGKFVIGRPVDSSGLVVAGGCCGSGLAASGGFGQIVADIVSDQPGNIDASIYDPNRFGPVDPTTDEFRKRCAAARSGKSRGNMSEDAALQAASEFVGEAFVFAVAGGAVWWEVEKSNAKDEKRREDAANERAQLCDIIDTQHRTMVDMSALIEELFEYKKSSSETIAAMQAGRRAAAR